LTPQLGVDVLKNAKENGVRVDIVNAMVNSTHFSNVSKNLYYRLILGHGISKD
jgi:hypothetical protein